MKSPLAGTRARGRGIDVGIESRTQRRLRLSAAEAVHDRAVPGHDVDHRRVVLRRTSRASCSRRTRRGIWNAYTIPVGRRARGRRSPSRPPIRPMPSRSFRTTTAILFTRDQGGNELNHLYVRTPDGEERDLTPGEKLKAHSLGWTPRRQRVLTSPPTSATRSSSTSIATTRRPTSARCSSRTRTATFRRRSRTTASGWRWRRRTRRTTATSICGTRRRRQTTHISQHKGDAQLRPAASIRRRSISTTSTNEGGEFAAAPRATTRERREHEDVEKADWDISLRRSRRRAAIAPPASTRTAGRA